MKYIAIRPRAERVGSHGLFGDEDTVDLEKAMTELGEYSGNIWTHIVSLKRADGERLSYDNTKAWRNLLRTHRNEIAATMNIPTADFRWYAAFHDEGHHPHVHMMAWSAKPGQAYLNQDGIRKIKSEHTRDIFRTNCRTSTSKRARPETSWYGKAARLCWNGQSVCARSSATVPYWKQRCWSWSSPWRASRARKSTAI